ncbi:SAM-dependent methyltransferase [Streptomyces sp. NPDC007983]|uniref:SAM-dependent methyltransferase n=1 Tax=Streptomyces sp. NPDC007983 TaxID=3364800 RepID=UPI0036E40E31
MDRYEIADQYTIAPAQAPPPDRSAYHAVLHSDFQGHYADGRDVWTAERAMRETPLLLIRALGDTGPGHVAHVLDVGTGHGRDAAILLDHGHRVTGIDIVTSSEWPAVTADRSDRARFLTTSVMELAGSAEYDAVLDNGCLHHQHPDDYPAYLGRIRALLRPGGLYTVSVFQSADERGRLFVNGASRLYQEFTTGELTALVTGHGFALVATHLVPRTTPGLNYLVGTFRSTEPGQAPLRP